MNGIAADIGGTTTRFALSGESGTGILHEQSFPSGEFACFEDMLQAFISTCTGAVKESAENLGALSLAFPGIVTEDEAKLTNLPWVIHKKSLSHIVDTDHIYFMNDFEASAHGIGLLSSQDILTLNPGRPQDGAVKVVTGAGTGLGLSWVGSAEAGDVVYATEGGHIDFAPTNEQQIGLLRSLLNHYDHVSFERILSGSGLIAVYQYFCGSESTLSPTQVNEQAAAGDKVAVQAMTMFTQIYGAYTGSLALMFKPRGGIYITGGIGKKMQPWMKSAHFLQSYLDKGRMSVLAGEIPVYLVMSERVGLLGAIRRLQGGNHDA